MRIIALAYVFGFLFSCTELDQYEQIQGFWVSDDYRSGKPFQTLTISRHDTNMYGAIPFVVETNQYGAYSFIEPLDTIHGQFEAYGPHWDVHFILKLEGETLVQTLSVGETNERKIRYVTVDSLKTWREAIFSDLLLRIDLPHASGQDKLIPARSHLVANLFLGPLRESLRDEYPAIRQDSTVLQVDDALLPSDLLHRFLHNEQSKLEELDRDSIIIVLNADSKIPEQHINEWVRRIKSFNGNLRVSRCYIDLEARKFWYRELSADDLDQ